ncbi:DUF4287 domain-containing protein [Salinibacterium sp. SYSU T00001]|uniref:DUF4287 domain-containing protein n=1 Tax=Homoserinimonas sedimenticola TaxID=2986805 RepID=UPI0022362BFE|nr:DUF4287 domain-containing protein [Salinibacterium sedimenticola]MCW4386401.1 DUF4287 domain-containing protein [Salinibacterium sedimenticola]
MAISRNEDKISSDKLEAATGRPREAWTELLDAAGATRWEHPQIAAWLVDEHGVDGWWAQGIAIAFEQARGMRVPGQQSDGTFAAGSSRTVPGEAGEVLEKLVTVVREWANAAPASVNAGAKHPSARWTFDDGSGVQALVSPVTSGAAGRVRASLTRTRLEGPDALAGAKAEMAELLRGL